MIDGLVGFKACSRFVESASNSGLEESEEPSWREHLMPSKFMEELASSCHENVVSAFQRVQESELLLILLWWNVVLAV